MNNLEYRRQFLFTPLKCENLENWITTKCKTHYLYVHPDCSSFRISKNGTEFVLIGSIIDPNHPTKKVPEILQDIAGSEKIEEITSNLYSLVGRFVLIVCTGKSIKILNDACGLKTVCYTRFNGEIYVASQPLLLKLVCKIGKSKNFYDYYNSDYVKKSIEHWIPSGTSLYENVFSLVPNHYLCSDSLNQIRYWPTTSIREENLEKSLNKFCEVLEKTMRAAANHFKLAVSLTAGWDSRAILSGCKDISNKIWCYTLQYRGLSSGSSDLKIPAKVSSRLGLKYNVIDCRKELDKDFAAVYSKNSDMSHVDDWGKIAHGMLYDFPADRIAVKGNCAEIGRCYYYPSGSHPMYKTSSPLLDLEEHRGNIEFIRTAIGNWFEEIKDKLYGYDLLDLFYWEQRMGSWQAQSQLEWDIVQDAFTPFNNRELIDLMLQVNPKYRCAPNYSFFKKAIKKLWLETLSEPINPMSPMAKVKSTTKLMLMHLGVFDSLKKLVKV